MGEELKDAEVEPQEGDDSGAPSKGWRKLFARKEAVLAMGGAAVAIVLAIGLMAWPSSGSEEAKEEKPPARPESPQPKKRPRKRVVDEGSSGVFHRAEAALRDGHAESAREILEGGLAKTPIAEAGLRSQYFQRLAQVAAHLGRTEAAKIFKRSGKRLAGVEEEARALLEEGFAALAAGDPGTARRRLYQFLLRSEDISEGRAVLKALAWRTITRAWFEEFSASGGLKKAALAEPDFSFERRR